MPSLLRPRSTLWLDRASRASLIRGQFFPAARPISRCALLAALTAVVLTVTFAPAARAQGSLTPPAGAPAPTMKSLDQLEPRTPISAATTPGDADSLYRIATPGSYYLTGNITGVAGKHGIEIAADGVTIDLGGFVLRGVAGSLSGISRPGLIGQQLTIRHGTVRDWVSHGIYANVSEGRFAELKLTANGGAGLFAGPRADLTDCVANHNGGAGFLLDSDSVLTRVIARHNGAGGIRASATAGSLVLTECIAADNTGDGFLLEGDACTLARCTAAKNTVRGFNLGSDSTLDHCTARQNTSHGYEAGGDTLFDHCTSQANHGHGFLQRDPGDISDSIASNNLLDGIHAAAGAKLTGNSARGNGQDGIEAGANTLLTHCLAQANTGHGIRTTGAAEIIECITGTNGSDGIHAAAGSKLTSSSARQNGDDGIEAGENTTLDACLASSNAQHGIRVASFAVLRDCTVRSNGTAILASGAGILMDGSSSFAQGCTIDANDVGVRFTTGVECTVIECIFTANDDWIEGYGATTHIGSFPYYDLLENFEL